MNPFMLISALVASYMCVVEGQSPCPHISGGQGSCISLYDCSELMAVFNKPDKNQQDMDTLRRSSCASDGGTPKVCCAQPPVAQQNKNTGCLTPDRKQGECVGITSCPHIYGMLQRPVSTGMMTFIQNSRCQGKDPYSVCCSPPPRVDPNPNPGLDPNPGPVPNKVCNGRPGALPPDPSSGCCGKQVKLGDRIVGGNITDPDEYPWLVLIEYTKDNRIKLLCGGALISDRYVLTAGHCVTGPVLDEGTPRNVRLGEFDTSNSIEQLDCVSSIGGGHDCTEGAIVIPIEQIIAHPQYNAYSSLKRHDIALLKLSKPAPFTDFIRPICLPSTDLTQTPPPEWQLLAAGWGRTDPTNSNSNSNFKLDVELPFVPQDKCQLAYSVPRRKVPLWQGQMCAGGEKGKDSCRGDSGGPLMWQNRNGLKVFEVQGIISFGVKSCGTENVPGVYTKVYEYLPWIRSVVAA